MNASLRKCKTKMITSANSHTECLQSKLKKVTNNVCSVSPTLFGSAPRYIDEHPSVFYPI